MLWGGDSVPHNVATQSIDYNINNVRRVTDKVLKIADEFPLFATLGNHDTYP